MAARLKGRVNPEDRKRSRKVNEALYQIGLKFWDYIPKYEIDSALVDNGFDATEPAIYCGRDGSIHEPVGHGKFLSLTWHKMDSGRYEIVAYLN
jgi:hypothetical protein